MPLYRNEIEQEPLKDTLETMPGLRSKQKDRRRQTIKSVAKEFFVEKGYFNTRMVDIARKSEVTIPTIYNYFGSKSNILLEITLDGENRVGKKLDIFSEDIPSDPIQAITQWLTLCVEGSLEEIEREIWRAVWLVEQKNSDVQLTQKLKDYHIEKTKQFLILIREKGMISETVNIDIVAIMLDSIIVHLLRKIVIVGSKIRSREKRQLRRYVEQFYWGLAPQATIPTARPSDEKPDIDKNNAK